MRAAIAGALALAAIVLAPQASADDPNQGYSGPKGDHDPYALWTDVQPDTTPVATMGRLAQTICGLLEDGVSEGHIIGQVSTGPHAISADNARVIIYASEWHYCPDKY